MKRTMMFAMVSLTMVGCSAAPQAESEELNVNPASLSEATESLASIEHLMRAQADDPRALDALKKLQPHLDELNHLVARVETRPGHVVSFYESEPGVIGVVEAGPSGEQRVLSPSDLEQAPVPLYERLSGGAKAPKALVQADARARLGVDQHDAELKPGLVSRSDEVAHETADVASTAQALTAGDGQWFRDNVCFKTGDFRECHPNRSNGAWFEYNTRTSFMILAPYYAPTFINVNLKYQGVQRFLYPVYQGETLSFAWYSGINGCGFFSCNQNNVVANHRWDLLNAAGKSYHWTIAAKWGCSNPTACQAWP